MTVASPDGGNNLPRCRRPSFSFVVQKLFTVEDPHMLHKVLGLLSVLSFIYRYGFVYPRTGTLGFDGDVFDWATIAVWAQLPVGRRSGSQLNSC